LQLHAAAVLEFAIAIMSDAHKIIILAKPRCATHALNTHFIWGDDGQNSTLGRSCSLSQP